MWGKNVHPIHFSLSPIGSLPSPDVTLSPTGSASTGSYISNLFLARGLFIALMMEAASTCETSVNFYQTTRRHNPEDTHLHSRRRENPKSYWVKDCQWDTYHGSSKK
jgi:hypothetical protein